MADTMMRRRDFVLALAGASVPTWARAQKSAGRRVGVLIAQAENDVEGQARIRTFLDQMAQLGWIEGQNLTIDYRWGAGVPARARDAANELIALAPDVILANGTPATEALQKATQSIPVVFVVVTNPVGAGFVESLSKPGANITGFSTFEPEIGGKWLELLRDLTPGLRRVGAVWDPAFPGFASVWSALQELAGKAGLEASTIAFRNPGDDLEAAIAAFARESGGGLIVFPSAINSAARHRIFAVAAEQHLPAVYPFQHYAIEGGLLAYGFDPLDLFRRGAGYVDRILKGAKPGDLPVQAPVKFELIINLQAARKAGITVPGPLLFRADQVID